MTDINEFPDIQITALPHPDDEVRRFGFDLTDPYVEQCWGATVGPSSVILMRRLPTLWTEHEPTVLPTEQLARSLGIGHSHGRNGSFRRTLERMARFRLGEWLEPDALFAVYTTAPPVSDAQLQRLPEWTRRAHERLLADHLRAVARRAATNESVTSISAHLDRLQQRRTIEQPPGTAIGR